MTFTAPSGLERELALSEPLFQADMTWREIVAACFPGLSALSKTKEDCIC